MENFNDIKIIKTTLLHLDAIDKMQKECEHIILPISSIENDLKINTYYYISAVYHDQLVGFAGISMLVDHADLLALVVKNKYKNKGIATLMMNSLIAFCMENNLEKIFLEVREKNYPAINLYEKCGFKLISIRKNYYKDDHASALIYLKEL